MGRDDVVYVKLITSAIIRSHSVYKRCTHYSFYKILCIVWKHKVSKCKFFSRDNFGPKDQSISSPTSRTSWRKPEKLMKRSLTLRYVMLHIHTYSPYRRKPAVSWCAANKQCDKNMSSLPPMCLMQRHNFDPNTVTGRTIRAIKMSCLCTTHPCLENNCVRSEEDGRRFAWGCNK